ncbi:sodium- and chloride-dependent transporter XTRP3B-like [Galleria mellonella]|uniref:Sodium- and chloride-dependent transporter XTRP3B-like n=1 Tax=Galleria mellonella TaxID=7137 RepID=A0A6J1X198_GALME|nr:sodium- and chloride-dependent transporter XTRP3B-like [Galleria mellonella]
MSDSASTRTKTLTDTDDTQSTDNSLIADRWTNNITYRQLVISSCIGIVQLWWHPYVHDLTKLVPFIFLYNVFSIFIGYPMFYLELALGVVTKKGVLKCWDLSPMARGIGYAMLLCCVFTALALGVVNAWCLAMLVHSFHSFLPWQHCAATARPACAARHRPLPHGSETPPQSFFFNFVLNLKREGLEGGLGIVVWELTFYYVISWILIYFITVKRIYSYSKLVLFKDVLTYFMLLSFLLGAPRLNGAGRMFSLCDWSRLQNGLQIWREAIEFSLIEMTVSQGVLVMLGVYCPKQQHRLATTSLLAFAASKSTCMCSAFLLGAVHGALQHDYDNTTNIWGGSSSAMVLWSDYVVRIPGSQFWSALLFFTMFVVSLSSTALIVQTIMSSFTGRSIRKITWAFLILNCSLFCIIGSITLCTQGGLYVLNFLMEWPILKPRLLISATVAIVVTYVYGQTTFCEDVYFAVGEYPSAFLRVCWALSPVLLVGLFLGDICAWPSAESMVGWLMVVITALPVVVIMLVYIIFKCRVRNMVRNEK